MEAGLVQERAKTSTGASGPLSNLVRRVAAGDEAALRVLYDATSPLAFGLALSILREEHLAEEAVANVYAQVWRQAGRHDPDKGSVATWVATLARTRSIDLLRARGRRVGDHAGDEA